MAPYQAYTPTVVFADVPVQDWAHAVSNNVNMTQLGWNADASRVEAGKLFHNAHLTTAHVVKNYVDEHVVGLNHHVGQALQAAFENNDEHEGRLMLLEDKVRSLEALVTTQAELLRLYKTQMDQIPADAGRGVSRTKVPDPPTFSGSDNKMNLEDWLNQLTLYCSATGIVTDHQMIVCALMRLRNPASTYMKKYFDDNRVKKDLGTWDKFVRELSGIYGQRDDKEGAKEEITQLWSNTALASKDFIKFAEQYRTLARIVEYEDKIHIDKIKGVIPRDLRNSVIFYELAGQMPTEWEKYLELLLAAYKELHPDKARGAIFGKSSGGKDPNAMEIDAASKGKGKPKEVNSQERKAKFCQLCANKGNKSKAKTHNTADCYDKPGNEGKRPKASTSSPSTNAQGNKGAQRPQGKPTWKARLMEVLGQLSDDDDTDTPAGTINVNTASIQEIDDPTPAEQGATARIDEVQTGPSRTTGQNMSRRVMRQSQMDFPEGL